MQTFTDVYRYRFVLSTLVGKNVKALYRNMALGLMWSLLNPLIMVTTLSLVFVNMIGDEHFTAKFVVALIPYNFFVYCLTGCSVSILGNVSLVKKIAFPRQILPISVILTHLFHFAVQSTLVVVVLIVFDTPGEPLSPALLWLPLIFIVQLGLCVGVGLLVAGLSVLYRDTQYVIESSMTVLFWASPMIYEMKASEGGLIPAHLQTWYCLNPLAGILESYRAVLCYGRTPDAYPLAMSVVVTLVIGYFGVRTFWKHEREFADLM